MPVTEMPHGDLVCRRHGAKPVDVDGLLMDNHSSEQFKNRRLVVYHFFTRSSQDWLSKMVRKGGWQGNQRPL